MMAREPIAGLVWLEWCYCEIVGAFRSYIVEVVMVSGRGDGVVVVAAFAVREKRYKIEEREDIMESVFVFHWE